MKEILNFKVLNSWLDLKDDDILIYKSEVKIEDNHYKKIGLNIDGEENYLEGGWLVITSIENDRVKYCELYYIPNDGQLTSMGLLDEKNSLRKNVIEDIIKNN